MDLPKSFEIAGVTLYRDEEAPQEIACWTTEEDEEILPLAILMEPAAPPSEEALESARYVLGDFEKVLEDADAFLLERLAEDYELSAADKARLQGEVPPFDGADVVVWGDGSWMLRFALTELDVASDFGIGVNFIGKEPESIADFEDVEEE